MFGDKNIIPEEVWEAERQALSTTADELVAQGSGSSTYSIAATVTASAEEETRVRKQMRAEYMQEGALPLCPSCKSLPLFSLWCRSRPCPLRMSACAPSPPPWSPPSCLWPPCLGLVAFSHVLIPQLPASRHCTSPFPAPPRLWLGPPKYAVP